MEIPSTSIFRSLIVGSAISLTLRVLGLALAYAAHILLSRSLGLHDYGEYVILLGWALVLTLPTRLGMDNSALRYATVYLEAGRHAELRAFIRVGALSILAAATVAAIGLVVVGRAAAGTVSTAALAWAAALIPPVALLGFVSALLRTSHRIFASQFYDQVLRPAALIVFIGLLVWSGRQPTSTLGMMLTSLAALVALGGILLHYWRLFSFLRVQPDYREWRSWYLVAVPLLAIGITQELLNQLEILLLGYLGDARMAGLFSAAWRLAALLPFGLQALAIIGAPMIASAYHREDRSEMFHVARLNARIGLIFAAAIAIVLLVAGRWLLAIFGREFSGAYPALAILIAGGMVNAFTGVVAYFLTLTGRERPALLIFLGALGLSLLLNVILIPRYGVIGAAIASSSALSAWNLAMLAYVRRVMGIDASAVGLEPRPPQSAVDERR